MRELLSALATVLLVACASTPATKDVPQGHAPLKEPPPHAVGSFAIDVPPTTLQPGDELTPCFIFPLVITGPSHLVGGGKLSVGRGMHHGNITTRPKTGEGARPCPAGDDEFGAEAQDVLNGGAVLFGSSTQVSGDEWQSFPEGMGFRVKDGFEIVARMHYLNVTNAALTVEPKYEWYTIDEAALKQELAPFAWTNRGFSIPPHSEYTASANCSFPNPMHVVSVLPHMHRLGTGIQASFIGGPLDGAHFLDSRGYDPDKGVMTQYEPAVDLSQGGQGTGASFSCSWTNTLDKTVIWGIGDNEMCVIYGYAYPPENTYSVLASGDSCLTFTGKN